MMGVSPTNRIIGHGSSIGAVYEPRPASPGTFPSGHHIRTVHDETVRAICDLLMDGMVLPGHAVSHRLTGRSYG